MSSFKSQCEIIIDKPAHVVYDFVTTVSNWIGIHPACKGIEGDDGLDKEATVGLRFTETIDVRGWVFQCHWEVRKMVKDQYFEFSLPTDFILPPVYNTIITYIFDPIGDNKTRFIRTMINCTNADATPEQKADFADTDMHTDYLNAVKARLEKS
ncbi:hypothetical protein PCG10_003963 [Penicillium crustosum]|uniref:Uncharacterized protein n=1 Tax=Penicillium crustosum TaxID=36656 RepID=A0A9P5GQR9_PENCR|nr:uncharacterized protein N7487_009910 [Penicillium crustosum]KAF7526572.1 hypothetical protein PCG10_003963 [Penicillium crustosum]KAJ5395607.1 hypothetical protein N7487_009910 [Penicillium crustosum]